MFIGNPIDYEFLKNTRIDVPTIGDKTEYLTLKQSMNVVGFSETDQRNIFSILSAILHLGNIKFVIEKEDEATILDKASLEAAAQLLGLTSPVLGRDLTYREMESASQNKTFYHIKLNRNEAIDATLGLAKALYKSLFSWIISQLNLQLQHHSKPEQPIIGVLDIFGFEIFESNSLEQLLINYANEVFQKLVFSFLLK